MKDFLRAELIKSLIFPGLCALWVIVRFFAELSGGVNFFAENFCRPISYGSALIFGCGLPVLLTLSRNVHTERYLKKRLIIFVVAYVGLSFLNLISEPVLYVFYYLFFGVFFYGASGVQGSGGGYSRRRTRRAYALRPRDILDDVSGYFLLDLFDRITAAAAFKYAAAFFAVFSEKVLTKVLYSIILYSRRCENCWRGQTEGFLSAR